MALAGCMLHRWFRVRAGVHAHLGEGANFLKKQDARVGRDVTLLAYCSRSVGDDDRKRLITFRRITPCNVFHCTNNSIKWSHVASM